MANGQITWEQLITSNNDAHGARYKFEDLCRQLFAFEFLSKNKIRRERERAAAAYTKV